MIFSSKIAPKIRGFYHLTKFTYRSIIRNESHGEGFMFLLHRFCGIQVDAHFAGLVDAVLALGAVTVVGLYIA